ncbi:acetylserotonin O-methyltransferase-like, partial [Grammomys surdaster]|uniref:acetylserotonin O-methyltransferase-like n=1 Tax=Grammomys surdaster TaxID=491861 RepID=UPI0010A08FEF
EVDLQTQEVDFRHRKWVSETGSGFSDTGSDVIPPPGSFANAPLADAFLVSGSPLSQRSMLLYLAGTPYRLWAHLADAVREGRSQYARAVGAAAAEDDPFAAIYRTEAERALFTRALRETWSVCGRRVLAAFDLARFRVVCDVGGGSGALAREAARLYPGSSVIVFDVPDVIAAARAQEPPPGEGEEAGPRVSFVEDLSRYRASPACEFMQMILINTQIYA